MNPKLSPILCLAVCTLFAGLPHAQDESAAPSQDAAPLEMDLSQTKLSPLAKATRFTDEHTNLRYTIFDYRKTLGQYSQKTKVSTLKSGREVLDLVDSYQFFRNETPSIRRTRALINRNFDLLEVSGDFGDMGKSVARFRNGKLTGVGLQGEAFEFSPPAHVMSRDLFQRGFYDLPTKFGESITVNMFALENTGEEKCYRPVTVISKGIEETTAQGVVYVCRKYVVRAEGEKRSAQYWFGPENRLIKLRTGLQTWELMAKGQTQPVPVVRKPNPLRKRKAAREKAKRENEKGQDEAPKKEGEGEQG